MRNSSFGEKNKLFLESILLNLRLKKINKYFKNLSEIKKLADIGCGYYAKTLQKILKDNPNINKGIGTDISVAKDINNKKIKLIKADLNNPLPISDNEIDIVISLAVIEHVKNYELALSEIHRILKPGGYLFLTTPSPISRPVLEFLAYRLKLLDETEIRDHKNYFSKNNLEKLVKQHSFQIIKLKSFQFGFNNFLVCKK